MNRREFITLLGGSAVAWPMLARAQQADRMRRIGVLTAFAETDAEIRSHWDLFQQRLQQLGWTNERNIRIDHRWAAADAGRMRTFARELVQLGPDVILAHGTAPVAALRQETSTIPIVFVQVTDPVRAGFVTSLARPAGNITGFSMYEPDIGAKWLEVLKEIAPTVTRVAIMFNPETAPGRGLFFLRSFEAAAPSFGVQPVPTPVHDAAAIERAIESLAREKNSGLFAMPDATTIVYRELITALAGRHRVPAIYHQRSFVAHGGLISYGIDTTDQFRQAATYVDRILRGTKPSELPVQGPTKFELAINLKTAKALGLTIPSKLLFTADEVIE